MKFAVRRFDATLLRARAGLALAACGAQHAHVLQIVDLDVAQLEQEQSRHAVAHAALLRAGFFRLAGDHPAGLESMNRAIAGLDACGMSLLAACARRCRGVWVGDRDAVIQADNFMRLQDIANPARWTATFGLT